MPLLGRPSRGEGWQVGPRGVSSSFLAPRGPPPGPPRSLTRGPRDLEQRQESGLTAEPYPPGTPSPPLLPPPPPSHRAGEGSSCPIALPPLLLPGQREEIAGIPPCSCGPCGAGGGHGFGAGRSPVWEGRLGADANPPTLPPSQRSRPPSLDGNQQRLSLGCPPFPHPCPLSGGVGWPAPFAPLGADRCGAVALAEASSMGGNWLPLFPSDGHCSPSADHQASPATAFGGELPPLPPPYLLQH